MAGPLIPPSPLAALNGGPSARPVLVLEGIGKHYGDTPAVEDVSLEILEGEFFSLLGPSGCGKTTLLRIIAGFERPDTGSLRLDGREISGTPPYLRPVNMMFQSYALFPHMSVEKNIAYGLKQDGLPREERRRRVDEALQLVELGPLAKRRPHQLSGGERQRVALARCLAKKPRMLLLDEPLAALDKRLREQMRLELVDLQKRLGTTFIMVTHDQQEAMGVSTRLAVMRRGRIAQIGRPEDVYESPATRYVAKFLGDTNLFEGTVRAEESTGRALLEGAAGGATLRSAQPCNGNEGRRAWLAVRPEKMRITPAGPDLPGENRLRGRVVDIGYQGHLSIYRVRLAGGEVILATQTNPHRGTPAIERDADVAVSWAAEAGVLLHD